MFSLVSLNNQINEYFEVFDAINQKALYEEIHTFIVKAWFYIKDQLEYFEAWQLEALHDTIRFEAYEKQIDQWRHIRDQLGALSEWVRRKKVK
jgi:hypothetical protein